jgi:quinoprotein glucose dehydrogenase
LKARLKRRCHVFPADEPARGLAGLKNHVELVRAFDVDTEKILWETQVAAALEGMPAVYEVNGKQYILFCASAQAGLTRETEETIQGAYFAFALPD